MNIVAYVLATLAEDLRRYLRAELRCDQARPDVGGGANGSKRHPHRPPIPEG